MNQQEVIDLMKSSKSEDERNANCDKVKKAFEGYPWWWYATIILGGVLSEARSNW